MMVHVMMRLIARTRRRSHGLGIGFLLALMLAGGCAARPALLAYGTPESVGMDSEALERAVDLYREVVEEDNLRGAVLLVSRRGTIVLHEAIGWRIEDSGEPIDPEALFRMASNTKAVICAAALVLEEDGVLSMDDPVGRWIPAFNHGDLARITLHHLATHGSGLPRGPIFLRPVEPDTTLQREATKFAERLELEREPGSGFGYSNVGYNVLGAVIEAATGESLEDVLRTRIYEPLGMHDSCNHESRADRTRMCNVYRLNDGRWGVRWRPGDDPDYPIARASGGMISSARDNAIFLQMMLDGGRFGRVRILSEDSVRRATSPLVKTQSAGYGYGWHVSDDGVLSHSGSDGTYVWVDPANELFGLVLTQSTRGTNPRREFLDRVTEAIVEGRKLESARR